MRWEDEEGRTWGVSGSCCAGEKATRDNPGEPPWVDDLKAVCIDSPIEDDPLLDAVLGWDNLDEKFGKGTGSHLEDLLLDDGRRSYGEACAEARWEARQERKYE